MAAPKERNEESYLRFLYYLDETGLDVELRAICLRHFVTPKDVYLNSKGPTVHAARLEIWWWLTTTIRKSHGEVGRLFDRDGTSILYAMRKLRTTATTMGAELDALHAADVARAVALSAIEGQARAGRQVAALAVARHKAIDDGQLHPDPRPAPPARDPLARPRSRAR